MTLRKLLVAGLLTTIAVIALGAAYFGFNRKENTMEQTHVENTNTLPVDAPASACAVNTDTLPADTLVPTHTENSSIPPIDASAPAHTETATFAMG